MTSSRDEPDVLEVLVYERLLAREIWSALRNRLERHVDQPHSPIVPNHANLDVERATAWIADADPDGHVADLLLVTGCPTDRIRSEFPARGLGFTECPSFDVAAVRTRPFNEPSFVDAHRDKLLEERGSFRLARPLAASSEHE
jgi:hypothetical protein